MNAFLRGLLVAVAVVAVGLLGYWLAPEETPSSPATQLDELYTLAVFAGEFVEPEYMTSSPDSAEAYLLRRFHRKVEVPRLRGLTLAGVGTLTLAEGIDVPVLIYEDSQGIANRVLLLNYALLDRLEQEVRVDTTLYRELEAEDTLFVRSIRAYRLGIWRRADDVYMLITLRNPRELVEEPNR